MSRLISCEPLLLNSIKRRNKIHIYNIIDEKFGNSFCLYLENILLRIFSRKFFTYYKFI